MLSQPALSPHRSISAAASMNAMASSNRGGQLRIPIRIDSEYVRQGDEQRLFPRIENYLTRAEVAEAWPGGVITHESFTHRGFSWRMHSGRAGGPSSPLLWLAVLDGDSSAYPTGRKSLSMGQTEAAASGQRAPTSPCSRPLVDLELDGSPGAMSMRPFSPATSPATSTGGWLHQQNAMQLRHAGMSMVVAQSQSQNKFIEDLLTAESSHNAMERYKALIRLMSALKRRIAQARIPNPHKAQSWESQEHQDILKQVVMVGECLARFGTAEFSERSNSSRAINTKDYATLLTQFLEAHGMIFHTDFIAQLPQVIQDEVLTVRSLLQTRCEANSIIFTQLVKHVGMEGQGNGQAVVYNTSVVTANPTSIAQSAPKMLMHAAANAWAKATEKRSNRFGLIGAAALLGLWILKGRLFGGRRNKGRFESADSEYEHYARRRGRGGQGGSGVLGLAERLLETRTLTERAAVSQMVACSEELQRAQQNIELLTHDWRMGQLRMGGGVHPPGFQPVDLQRCSLGGYLNRLDDPYYPVQYSPASRSHHAVMLPPPLQAPSVYVTDAGAPDVQQHVQQQAKAPSKRQQKQDRKRTGAVAAVATDSSPLQAAGGAAGQAQGNSPLDAALSVIPAIGDMFKL